MNARFLLPEPWEARAIKDVPLADYTSFRIGGQAARLIEVAETQELIALAQALHAASVPWRLLGAGSNVLVSDEGYDGLIVVFRGPKSTLKIEGMRLTVSGGVDLHEAVLAAVEAGLQGLEFAAGLPGTVGGALFGNAGAFGEAVGSRLESARLMRPDGSTRQADGKELGFAYRSSLLKQTREAVLEAIFMLQPGSRPAMQSRVDEILALRKAKHPDWRVIPCAGSIFRNVAPTSAADRRRAAGALLEQAGAKTMREGGAAVFPKHANIIINTGGANCADVLALARRMRAAVQARFGIALAREVQVWPEELAAGLPEE